MEALGSYTPSGVVALWLLAAFVAFFLLLGKRIYLGLDAALVKRVRVVADRVREVQHRHDKAQKDLATHKRALNELAEKCRLLQEETDAQIVACQDEWQKRLHAFEEESAQALNARLHQIASVYEQDTRRRFLAMCHDALVERLYVAGGALSEEELSFLSKQVKKDKDRIMDGLDLGFDAMPAPPSQQP